MGQHQPRDDEEKQEDWVNGKWFAMGRLALAQKHKRSCKEWDNEFDCDYKSVLLAYRM